jgi:hypothetical protein
MRRLSAVTAATAVAVLSAVAPYPVASADVAGCYQQGEVPAYSSDIANTDIEGSAPVYCAPPGAAITVNDDAAGAEDASATKADLVMATALSAGPSANFAVCDPYTEFVPSHRYADFLAQDGPTYSNWNNNAQIGSSTFTSTNTRTVTSQFSASFSVDEGIIFAGIKQTYGVSLSNSMTAGTGTSITVSTPPKTFSNGRYGVYEVVVDGDYVYHNQYCDAHDRGNVRVYGARKVGWYAWNSSS